MELTGARLQEATREYEREEPLFTVEADRLATLPKAFHEGSYGWKDAEWVVRWYGRRSLGEFPQQRREAIEGGFRENEFGEVRDAIERAIMAESTPETLRPLTGLSGVNVPVASAFCFYLDPDAFLPVGPRTWTALAEDGEIEGEYPDPPSPAEYVGYLDVCRTVADRSDLDLVDLYRALWRLGGESEVQSI